MKYLNQINIFVVKIKYVQFLKLEGGQSVQIALCYSYIDKLIIEHPTYEFT